MPVTPAELERLIFDVINAAAAPVDTQDLYSAAEKRFTFDAVDNERMPSKGKPTTDLAWKRNLRFRLQELKETDRLVNIDKGKYRLPTPNPLTALPVEEAWDLVADAGREAKASGRTFESARQKVRYRVLDVDSDRITVARLDGGENETLSREETMRAVRYLNNAGGRTGRTTLQYTVAKEVTLVELHPALRWSDDASAIEVVSEDDESVADRGTYLLTWNAAGTGFDEWERTYARVRAGERFERDWSTGNRKSLPAGSRFFFMRQGLPPTGIVGAGYTTQDVATDGPKWNAESKRPANYTMLEFEALFDADREPILTFEELMKIHPVAGVWNVASSGSLLTDAVAEKLEAAWGRHLRRSKRTPLRATVDDLEDPQDARVKRLTETWARDQQGAFRERLFERYGRACQITGCTVMSVVQACHLRSVSAQGSDRADNGLLMRIDLHVLFDAGRLGVDPDTLTVHVCASLSGTEYAELQGRSLSVGRSRPNPEALAERWRLFCATRS